MTRLSHSFCFRTGAAILAAVLFVAAGSSVAAQQVNSNTLTALEELRWGVTAYHAGNFNESIVSLNRSLAFDSDAPLTRYWLGRAYYSAGFEDAALTEWEWLVTATGRSALMDSWMERIARQRGMTEERLGTELTPGRLVTMAEVQGVQGDRTIFRRPAMIRPRNDGYFYVASFATHQVVLMDPNGVRKDIIDGGLEGFDRPFDMVLLDTGELLVTEFGADRVARISQDGFKIGSFGGTGRGAGKLLGPQYIAADEEGYVYVCDYGNRRIVKYSTDGQYVLDFGTRAGAFAGLREPTGLAVHAGRVYVSDAQRGQIFVFDPSGNYEGSLAEGELGRPESLSVYTDGILLIADENRLYALEIETERLTLLSEFAPRHRLIGATVDANRNVLVSDFESDRLLFLAPSEELYTGLTVEVDHVIASEHPEVFIAVNVVDRNGNPLLGLDSENFRITEDRYPVGEATVVQAGYQTGELAVAVIAERTASMAGERSSVEQATRELSAEIDAVGKRWLVTAGAQPLVESAPGDGPLEFTAAAAGAAGDYGRSALDLAIRLAGRQVVREMGRRTVILLTDGAVDAAAFDNYGLVETAAFLRNNHITFNVIYTRRNRLNEELEHLVTETGGYSQYVFQPTGLRPLIRDLASRPSGTYLLSYSSGFDTDFGRRYIPVEVEAYLLRRSGRDEAGYFGPLEF